MNNPVMKGKGKAIRWIRDHAAYTGDECLIWPFGRIEGKYGRLGYLGQSYYAHRYMCELVKGPPPSDLHQATHTCGRGMDACVNPNHLEWKTNGGNQADRRDHGTKNNAYWGMYGKLKPVQVAEILALKGQKTQRDIAALYGVTFQTISNIHRGKSRLPQPPFKMSNVITAMKAFGRPIRPREIQIQAGINSPRATYLMMSKLARRGDVQRVGRGRYVLPE